MRVVEVHGEKRAVGLHPRHGVNVLSVEDSRSCVSKCGGLLTGLQQQKNGDISREVCSGRASSLCVQGQGLITLIVFLQIDHETAIAFQDPTVGEDFSHRIGRHGFAEETAIAEVDEGLTAPGLGIACAIAAALIEHVSCPAILDDDVIEALDPRNAAADIEGTVDDRDRLAARREWSKDRRCQP